MEKSLQLVFKNAAGSSKIITISNPKENLTKAETDEAMQKSSQPTFSTPSEVTWYKLLKLVWSIVTSKFWRKKH